jgi:hypothetical protein
MADEKGKQPGWSSVLDKTRTQIVEQVELVEETARQHRAGLVNPYEFANRLRDAEEKIRDALAFAGGWMV